MKARYKGPAGTGIIEIDDTASVQDLFDELRAKTGIQEFAIKYGPPMDMKTLDSSSKATTAKETGLHGETLTIVPRETRSLTPFDTAQPKGEANMQEPLGRHEPPTQSGKEPDDIVVPWAEREGTLLLRIMPSDNSCLFTAFGGALPKQIPAQRLRKMMADYIEQHTDVYTEAVLGSPPSLYCRSIQDPERWGGGIELSILSNIFDIQICTFDVQATNLMKFGEDKRDRCILVYSGIHYDRVAFSYTEFPHQTVSLPPDMDRTIWPSDDDVVLEKAHVLIEKLHEAHYFTDTEGLVLKCDTPGCDWIGSGQAEGKKHAEATGHSSMSEIRDNVDDNLLQSCDTPGCDFMGQGEKASRQHRLDTGHKKFSAIPDW